MKNKLSVFILFFLVTYASFSQAQVKAPNYDFSLDMLQPFFPDKGSNKIPKKYTSQELSDKNGIKLIRYNIKHVRYVFAVFVHSKSGIIQDFYTRLPTFFLHNLFHQSLINRYKKQDLYKNHEKQSIYIWKNFNGLKITYGAACTITCFPSFLAVEKSNSQSPSFLQEMTKNLELYNSKDLL